MAILLATLIGAAPVSALFTKSEQNAAPAEGAPIAENMEIQVYKDIPYTGKLTAIQNGEDALTFSIVKEPKKGVLSIEDDTFCYTAEKSGRDSFTYVAQDAQGNVSAPAVVEISIRQARAKVTYADMTDHAAATAAVRLAEEGVFTGSCVSGSHFFEPERVVSRGEFVAMAMAATGAQVEEVTMTGFCDDAAIPVWAKSYASAALRDGVVCGVMTDEGVAFVSDAPITLGEAATVLNRLLSVTDVDAQDVFAPGAAVPAWAQQAVANMESVSVIPAAALGGEGFGEAVTRESAAQMLCAAMDICDEREGGGFLSWLY
ncbi:MAG: surface layer protein [Oscillospiraceae bacterium]|nr:surface layer protein [Oscillospiraceae bacterium]